MKHQEPYKLIAKFLANQCTENEKIELNNWRTLHPENEKLFTELRSEWELVNKDLFEDNVYPDKEKVWNKIQLRIKKPVITYSKSFLIRVASIAATIALLIGFSFSYLLKTTPEIPVLSSTFIAPEGQKSQLVLADGTKVWLNSGTSITYTNKFGEKDRTIKLNGEAFFDVKKNKELKFIVSTGKIDVVVHGTAFNVKSYPADADISVSLLRGKVDVVAAQNDKSIAMLAPGQQVIISKANMKSVTKTCDADLEGIWRLERLKFEGASISEVAQKLSKWYGVTIEVANTNNFNKYWFTVTSESLTDILKSMNSLHPISYKIKNDHVIINSR